MNEPQKPISVIVNETKADLVSAFNSALHKLHPTLLEPIVRDLYLAVQNEKEKVEKGEKAQYEKDLEEFKNESDEELPEPKTEIVE